VTIHRNVRFVAGILEKSPNIVPPRMPAIVVVSRAITIEIAYLRKLRVFAGISPRSAKPTRDAPLLERDSVISLPILLMQEHTSLKISY
jgi:hypothetical protein